MVYTSNYQVNGSELNPSGPIIPVIGDLSRPSSVNRDCDDEPGCADVAKPTTMLNGDRCRRIETSTDTLVADGDVEERLLRARSSTLVARDATIKCHENDVKEETSHRVETSEKCGLDRKCKANGCAGNGNVAKPLLEIAVRGSRLARPWEVPAAAQERADAYFKNRCDSDGLPVHQTEAQRRLVAIYFTHQEQVRHSIAFELFLALFLIQPNLL